MEETNGINIAFKVLGERISQLESDLRYERMMKEDAQKKFENLLSEHAGLVAKLDKVRQYIERMEE